MLNLHLTDVLGVTNSKYTAKNAVLITVQFTELLLNLNVIKQSCFWCSVRYFYSIINPLWHFSHLLGIEMCGGFRSVY